MAKTNDDLMYELILAKRKGEKIFYGPAKTTPTLNVEDDHAWDLNNNAYKIRRRREYIIRIRDGKEPVILETSNNWTRSDFGRSEDSDFILMREVYQEEM